MHKTFTIRRFDKINVGFPQMNLYAKLLLCSICVAFIAVRLSVPSFNKESLKGARVLVTGASTGIGEQLAYHYARLGAQLVIMARRRNVLEQVVSKCKEMRAQRALFIPADMANPSDAESVVQYAIEQLGGLDYMVLGPVHTECGMETWTTRDGC